MLKDHEVLLRHLNCIMLSNHTTFHRIIQVSSSKNKIHMCIFHITIFFYTRRIESVGNPYGGSPAVPGSIFYTHSVSVSAAHSAANSYQLPPGAMYSYPPGPSASSRPSFSIPNSMGSKEDAPPTPKHHAGIFVGQGGSSVQQISRSQL